MGVLIIEDRPLKDFLRFFNNEENLELIELGDTWHSTSGFVDHSYFNHVRNVQDLLMMDYDFNGLVVFIAKIRGLSIYYHGDYYKINGDEKEIDKIKFNGLLLT